MEEVCPVAGNLGGGIDRKSPLVALETVAQIRLANTVSLNLFELGWREVLVQGKKTTLSRNLPHEGMIDDYQVISVCENLDRSLTEFTQAARFPFDRDFRMLLAKTARGCQQRCEPAIMFPGYSAQSLRPSNLHFVQ
jgi:hypothetical protein